MRAPLVLIPGAMAPEVAWFIRMHVLSWRSSSMEARRRGQRPNGHWLYECE